MDRRTAAAKMLLRDMTEVTQGASMGPKNDAAISVFEPRCRVYSAGSAVKNLPNGEAVRRLVDSMLLLPASYRETLKAIEPLMQDWPEHQRVSYDSIRAHQSKHVGFEKWATREIAERRAQEKGLDVSEGGTRLLTVAAVTSSSPIGVGSCWPRENCPRRFGRRWMRPRSWASSTPRLTAKSRSKRSSPSSAMCSQPFASMSRSSTGMRSNGASGLKGLQQHGMSKEQHDADQELEEEIAAANESNYNGRGGI